MRLCDVRLRARELRDFLNWVRLLEGPLKGLPGAVVSGSCERSRGLAMPFSSISLESELEGCWRP